MTNLYVAEFTELAGTEQGDSVPCVTLPPDNESVINNTVAPVGAPTQTAPSTAASGGTIANGTYYLKITATTANGESLPSGEQNITTTGAGISTITANWNAVTGATGYKVYIGTAAGQENLVATVGAVTTDTLTALPGTSGSPPSGTNTAAFVALKPTTRWVVVSTDSICSIKVGPNADCSQTNLRLAANERLGPFRVANPTLTSDQVTATQVQYSNATVVGAQSAPQVSTLKLSTVLNT